MIKAFFINIGKFLSGIFQDVGNSYSAKRTAFFILVLLLVVIVYGAVYLAHPVTDIIFNGLIDLIKFLGGFIVAERVPDVIRSFSRSDK